MIWVEVICDNCNDYLDGDRYRRGVVTALKKEIKTSEWKEIDGKLYCPKCYEEIKRDGVR